MEWARILAYITGTVDQELLLRNEYLAAENRILKALHRWPLTSAEGAMPSRSPDSICTRADFREISQRHLSVKIDFDAICSRVDSPVPFFYFCPRASIAASTFGGDIGNSVSRIPTARSIALAMAAIGGQMLTSATPLAPYG